jgi:hypothetical protein
LRAAVHDDLRAITRDPGFQRAAQECGQVMVPGFRARPLVLLDTDAPVRVGNLPDGVPGVVITYADEITAVIFNLGVSSEARRQAAPLGARTLADNGWWRAYAAC